MAESHMTSIVKILYRYCMSLKNTNSADSTSPTPMLNIVIVMIGYKRKINRQWKDTPSITTNKKNIRSIRPKLIKDATFCDSRNRYLGTLTLVMMPLFAMSEAIPWFVDSEKNWKILRPAKTYTIKWGISRPKKWVKTRTMTNKCNSGPSMLQPMPSIVRL